MKPIFLLGNLYKANFLENFLMILKRIHLENRKKKILGLWFFYKPNVMVMDLDIIKRILIRDFNNFRDRGIEVNVDLEPLTGMLIIFWAYKTDSNWGA